MMMMMMVVLGCIHTVRDIRLRLPSAGGYKIELHSAVSGLFVPGP